MAEGTEKTIEKIMEFDSNKHLATLLGPQNKFLFQIEHTLRLSIGHRGNKLSIKGNAIAAQKAEKVLASLYTLAGSGEEVDEHTVALILREGGAPQPDFFNKIDLRGRNIKPRTLLQGAYLKDLKQHDIVFGVGPAGTGKTYLAVAMGVSMLISGEVEKLIISRPAVEAGERLGFLPGDLKEKVDPYLQPIYDALHDMLPSKNVEMLLESGDIEIAPLAFMRGRTLSQAYVILDEAQNTTTKQMKMFLTRLGEGSRMVITGDMSQVDLPSGERSGLIDAFDRLKKIKEISFVEFSDQDVVRHPLVSKIVRAYGHS